MRMDVDALYERLMEEEDARVCRDIPPQACTRVPANFFRQWASQVLTSLGDALVSPKTTLAWLMGALGAPAALVAWLVPLRESLSMLPQLFIAGWVRRRPRRRGVWLWGSALQALALLAMAAVAAWGSGTQAGLGVLLCLVLFSLARGLCSVAGKDVIGKTVPKSRRGRLNGWAGTASGLLALGFGLYVWWRPAGDAEAVFFVGLLCAAAALWGLATVVYAGIDETPGATEGGHDAIREALARLSLLREDAGFRRFVMVRALLLCSALSSPYYVLLAQDLGSGLGMLGVFIVANGLAGSLSAAVWGRLADRSSRQVLWLGAVVASALGFVVVALTWLNAASGLLAWLYPPAFFVLGVAHSGVRIGRKTYVLDMAGGQRRTDYVAVGNSVIGLILLLTGLLGLLTPWIGAAGMLLLLSAMGAVGAWMARGLKDVSAG